MNPLMLFAATAAAALIAAVWQGAALAIAVALILRLVPAIPAAVRSLLWTATFGVIVCLHLTSLHHTAGLETAQTIHISPFWCLAVAAIWLVLSLFRATQFLLSALRLRQIARRATPIDLTNALNTSRRYTLCTSEDVDRPSVLGFFHPHILLPPSLLATLGPDELHQILLHETEHLRRSDDWANLFQKLALVVFPLNPALAWVERRMCLERELACDDRVLEATGARKAYATCLTHLAEHSMLHRGLGLALGLIGNRPRTSELSTRVHRILSRPVATFTHAQTRFATAALLFGIAGASSTLAHTPSLVSFAPVPAAVSLASNNYSNPAWTPRPTLVKATVPNPAQPQRRIAHRAIHRTQPRVIMTAWSSTRIEQPRMTLTLAAEPYAQESAQPAQVQQFVVPAVAYVPAYAAVRVPNGWVIFKL